MLSVKNIYRLCCDCDCCCVIDTTDPFFKDANNFVVNATTCMVGCYRLFFFFLRMQSPMCLWMLSSVLPMWLSMLRAWSTLLQMQPAAFAKATASVCGFDARAANATTRAANANARTLGIQGLCFTKPTHIKRKEKTELRVEVVLHKAYSPDFSPSDDHLLFRAILLILSVVPTKMSNNSSRDSSNQSRNYPLPNQGIHYLAVSGCRIAKLERKKHFWQLNKNVLNTYHWGLLWKNAAKFHINKD